MAGGETVARVSALDKEMRQRVENAREAGKVLRYVISVDGVGGKEGEATAGIREVEESHPYAGLQGASFCVMYKTKVRRRRVVRKLFGCQALYSRRLHNRSFCHFLRGSFVVHQPSILFAPTHLSEL